MSYKLERLSKGIGTGRTDGLVDLRLLTHLFPDVEEELYDPKVPTIQISHDEEKKEGSRLPNADELITMHGGAELIRVMSKIGAYNSDDISSEKLYEDCVEIACSYEPMTIPEIARVGERLALKSGRLQVVTTESILDRRIYPAARVVYIDKREHFDNTKVFVYTNLRGFKNSLQPDGDIKTNPRVLALV